MLYFSFSICFSNHPFTHSFLPFGPRYNDLVHNNIFRHHPKVFRPRNQENARLLPILYYLLTNVDQSQLHLHQQKFPVTFLIPFLPPIPPSIHPFIHPFRHPSTIPLSIHPSIQHEYSSDCLNQGGLHLNRVIKLAGNLKFFIISVIFKMWGFKMVSFNIASIFKHYEELQILIEKQPLDLLCINEFRYRMVR